MLIGWVTVVLLDVEFGNTWFVGSYTIVLLAGGLAFGAVVLGVLGAVFSPALCGRRNLAGLVLFLIVLEFIAVQGIAGRQRRLSERRGEQIVEALTRYATEAGAYPADLALLSPQYLPTVPYTAIGITRRPFLYSIAEDGSYRLRFIERLGMYLEYNPTEGLWYSRD